MKIVFKACVLVVFMLLIVLSLITLNGWRVESVANADCRGLVFGEKFNALSSGMAGRLKKLGNSYSYMYISGYAEAYECVVVLDDFELIKSVRLTGPMGEVLYSSQ